jgi:predicted DNA-binding protein YlxM (UPF0122 family)
MDNQATGCLLTRREHQVTGLYSDFSARELAQRFTTTPGAIREMVRRARRKCPALRQQYQSCRRVRCASQIGSADAPLNLDSLN